MAPPSQPHGGGTATPESVPAPTPAAPSPIAARGRVLAWAILAVTLLATAGGWYLAKEYEEDVAAARFAVEVARVELAIESRLAAYEQVLRGGQGLFVASGEVTRAEWQAYVAALKLDEHFPGIQGVGYSVIVPPERLQAHIDAVRAEGFPNYTLWPRGEREVYTAIVYLEPFEKRNLRAFGFDMFQEPVRNAAMARARDEGVAALSGKVRLVQEDETDVQPGVLLYLPYYGAGEEPRTVEERRDRLVGWVYSPFRARDLMRGIVGTGALDIGFEVYDGPRPVAEALLFDSDETPHVNATGGAPLFERVTAISTQGSTWSVYYATTPAFEREARTLLEYLVAGFGAVGSLLLFGMTRAFVRRQEETVRSLQETNEFKTRFLNMAAHELRTPLTPMKAQLALLRVVREKDLTEEQRRSLDVMHRNTERLAALVEDILEGARYQAGALKLRRQEVAADEVARQAVESYAAEAARVGVAIEARAEAGARVHADPRQLAQVLDNLVGNALKFTPSGGRVAVEVARRGDEVVFTVEDTGIGFPAERASLLFQPFSQIHDTSRTSTTAPGVGLGLYISKGLVEAHGGRIWAESDGPGRGARFSFALPAR